MEAPRPQGSPPEEPLIGLLPAHELQPVGGRESEWRHDLEWQVLEHGDHFDLGRHLAWMQRLAPLFRPFLNTAAQGAWPTLMGATWPDAEPNMYFGPSGIGQVKGPAKIVQGNAKSQDPELARKLWEVSEELTNVRYLS